MAKFSELILEGFVKESAMCGAERAVAEAVVGALKGDHPLFSSREQSGF